LVEQEKFMSTSNTRTDDMRRNQRFQVSHVIRAVNRQTGNEVGRIVNISADGIMLLGDRPIEENSILELILSFGDRGTDTIALGVENLWCHSNDDHSQFWSGYCIIDISQQDMERLLRLAR
jgi:hypothetical protein